MARWCRQKANRISHHRTGGTAGIEMERSAETIRTGQHKQWRCRLGIQAERGSLEKHVRETLISINAAGVAGGMR
jgi:hypothetical protein